MTDHYREAEKLLDLARKYTYAGGEHGHVRATLLAARAQGHATLALAPWPTEPADPAEPETAPEPEAVPFSDAYAKWGDCVIRGGRGDLANVSNGCHIWLTVFGAPTREPRVWTTGQRRKDPATLVARLAPWPEPEPWAAPGEDVTMRLLAGDAPPDGTILRDREGDMYRVEADGKGTMRVGPDGWSEQASAWSWNATKSYFSWCCYAPIHVATPEEIRAAGIEVQS